jgi:hypothetical protein
LWTGLDHAAFFLLLAASSAAGALILLVLGRVRLPDTSGEGEPNQMRALPVDSTA